MNKCFRCGFETLENANFCSNCGVALKDPMPEIVYLKEEEKCQEEEVREEGFIIKTDNISESSLNYEMTKGDNVNDEGSNEEESTEDKSRKILWIPEWAFCTMVLVVGIVAIVIFKFINDPSFSNWCNLPFFTDVDTVSQIDGLNESSKLSINIVDSVYDGSVYTPMMNALDEDSTKNDTLYHVVVMTLKTIESAQKIVSSKRFPNSYILSDSTLHRIAVYNSINQTDAKHYLDSIANKECPGAWIFNEVK
jgi:hypothetical protein